MSELLEISLLNRLLREKLNSKIFYSIEFNDLQLCQLPGYFAREILAHESQPLINLKATANFKTDRIDPFVTELINQVSILSPYFKSIGFFDLGRAGNFIIPLAHNFLHITSLKIDDCIMKLKDFNQLIPKLDKLEFLYLIDCRFMKLLNEGPIEHEAHLPPSLKELHISTIYLITNGALSNSYDLLFNYDISIEEEEFYLTSHRISSIKKLELCSSDNDDKFICSFLSKNPQLTHIKLPLSNFIPETIKILSENDNIEHMNIDLFYVDVDYSEDSALPKLSSLTSLSMPFISKNEYTRVLQIIDTCPNLTKLDLEIANYSSEFISTVLDKLKKLKWFKLIITNFNRSELDFSLFSNIETLKFASVNKRSIPFKFPSPPMKLKSITILSGAQYIENSNYLSDPSINNVYWKFKIKGDAMICRAVNSD
ncbi:hypothetical protein CONCODRAFT_19599 [Conidiobolus coronatus NRRL 28638]|uniref:RNI-like protein n=1 Tax=Conidiobolus coronatus (strain ATCC 28846 / CBS 209.66 / NRRL 28638) TaxID=796925 RepID=A0A137NXL8_CONC2|nr:hypothetical protein CONCODRAFT_19599 [Conidiobolus coronatus NRRL 28638]|eukprot:KXN67432.1 hypothetical protein CONCODRAFT_19599 [Conidiobolus coronatus NRRL 28638]